MSTIRKISFTLVFVLLLSPLVGQVRAANVSTLVMEGAVKGVGGWVAGQAMDSIFPLDPKESPSIGELAADIKASTVAIESKIDKAVAAIEAKIDEKALDVHLGLLDSLGATPVSTAVGDYDPVGTLNPLTDLNIQTNDEDIQKVISATTSYSTDLSTDIKIGTDPHGYNGFWRSFPIYVSNKVTNLAFRIERWHAKQSQTAYKADGSLAYQIVEKNLQNLEDIYNHIEKDVPSLPISDGSPLERHRPIQQNLNCVIRTDPETQLVTSKGEFIRRYAGYDDVADHLPNATNVWRMWEYCRGDKSNQPPAYYGWENTNYEWAAGKHVGPTDDINECRLISTFGECQSSGGKYGCVMKPNPDPKHLPSSTQGIPASGWVSGQCSTDGSNEIGGHKHDVGRTWYTKFLWSEAPKVLDGSPAHCGQGPNMGKWQKSSLTGQGTFVNYLRTWENTVCAMGPDGKKTFAEEFPNAPALPHLTNALFNPNSKMPTNNWPKKITDSLPLTVIKTMTPTAEALTHRDADTSAVYYFIKRNPTNKTAELSKPYQSALSAAHDRSLHYFTEFKDEGLHTAYCQIALMVSIGNQILPTLEARIKQKELVSTKNTPKPSQITTMLDSYRQVSHKLGITKENAAAASCFPEAKSNHIVASLHDQMTQAIEVSDHMIRSCLKLAAINEWGSNPSHSVPSTGQLTSEVRAACNAHRDIAFTIKDINAKF